MKKLLRFGIIHNKLLYTFAILFIYLIGRCIPLYGIDTAAYEKLYMDSGSILMQAIGGDSYHYSLFVLGVSPYMLSTILMQVVMVFFDSDAKAQISPRKKTRWTLNIMLVIAVLQAFMQTGQLLYLPMEGHRLLLVKGVTLVEMTAGAVIILWLSERNRKYGVGGQTALILVNIIDGLFATISGYPMRKLILPICISLVVMIIVIVMENTDLRIVVQRISIHNIYADKNYLAIKLNPIGIMPVMFASAFFMIPRMMVTALGTLFPENAYCLWLKEQMVLTKPLGIAVYVLVLYVLTIVFSMIFINPKDITEQFLKSGDSILNLHAGRDTRRYLRRCILRLGVLSATVMSICVAVPLVLQFYGMESSLVMLPSSVMMLTGIFCGLYQEVIAIVKFDSYRPFM